MVDDCGAALECKPGYVKVLMRRAAALQALDKLDEAAAGGCACVCSCVCVCVPVRLCVSICVYK